MSKDTPFFSIVICTHNRSKMLPRAVDSVLAQTFQDWELLIIDDHSTDNTQEVIEKYLRIDKISSFRNNENLGNYRSRNTVLSYLRGKYTTILDDDDELPSDALQLRHNKLADGCSAVVHSNILMKTPFEKGEVIRPWFANPKLTYQDLRENKVTDDYCQIVGATMTIKTNVLIKTGGWDYVRFPRDGGDIDFALVLLAQGIEFAFVEEPTYIYNLHKGQLTNETTKRERKEIAKKLKLKHPYVNLERSPKV